MAINLLLRRDLPLWLSLYTAIRGGLVSESILE
jgi:hypothetical protein